MRPVMVLDTELLAFVAHALREHERTYRRNGVAVPAGVADLVDALALGVSQGQAGSPSPQDVHRPHVAPVTQRLVSYDTAAEILAVSVSSVKRAVRAGVFHPVTIGGCARLRVTELDEFIDQQANSERKPA